ncbi:hypothetical protein C8Q78DRAFT_983444 [Trametes maxima]|nr:hypothetical protein C8Q78DRAFT_983444 [Trametes maxima]
MSSSSDDELAQIIAYYQSVFINSFLPNAVLTLLCYEWLITFDREITLFWRRKFTGATALFLTNRYLPICIQILNLAPSHALMSDAVSGIFSCDAYTKALQAIQISQYLPWAAFSALRTFALSRRNWMIATVVLVLSLVPVGINLSQYHWLVVINDPTPGGCGNSSTVTLEMAKKCKLLTIASRTCMMTADVIVLIVTWVSTLGTIRLTKDALKGRPAFATMLVRDGTIYFVVLLLLNTLHLTFTMLSITNDALSAVSYFTVFTEPITAILVSRFLLDLQQVNQYNQRSTPTALSQSATLDFAKVLGSIGGSLGYDEDMRCSPTDESRTEKNEDSIYEETELGTLAGAGGSISEVESSIHVWEQAA